MQPFNFLEELKAYFDSTPEEKFKQDWEKTLEFDNVLPTMEEFIESSNYHWKLNLENSSGPKININIENLSPEYSSGFLLYMKFNLYAKSSILN